MADFLADFLKNNPEHPLLSQPFTVLNLSKAQANKVANDHTIGSLCHVAAQFHKNEGILGLGLQFSAVLRGILVGHIRQQMMLEAPAAVSEVPALDPEIRGYLNALATVYYRVKPTPSNIALDFMEQQLEVWPETFTAMMTRGLLQKPAKDHEFLLENLLLQLVEEALDRAKEP
jgi:hypothetical protein